MVKIGLERINIEEGVTVKMLLDNRITELIISLKFIRKQRFKIKKLIYIRNIDGCFNKEKPIKYIVEINIYYQRYKKRTKINMIRGQKMKYDLENVVTNSPQS